MSNIVKIYMYKVVRLLYEIFDICIIVLYDLLAAWSMTL